MIVTESILSGETIDILRPLDYCRYITLFSKSTKNLHKEIIGVWRIIPRMMYIMRPYPDNNPLGSNLTEFCRIDFCNDGVAQFLVDWPKDKKSKWEIIYKDVSCLLKCQVEQYSSNVVLFYDEDLIFTDEYILVKETSIPKYETFQNVLGYLAKLEISAYFYIYDKRAEILKKTGSKNKTNEYIDNHQDDIVCMLCPKFSTMKTKFFDLLDSIF